MARKLSLLPENIETPQDLLNALQKHDWWYAKAEDHSEYSRGRRDMQRIEAALPNIPNGREIYKHYASIRNLIDYGHS